MTFFQWAPKEKEDVMAADRPKFKDRPDGPSFADRENLKWDKDEGDEKDLERIHRRDRSTKRRRVNVHAVFNWY